MCVKKSPAHSHVGCERGALRGVLEDRLQTELEYSRVEGCGDVAEVALRTVEGDAADITALELGVVEDVEALRAQFQLGASSFAQEEALVERQVPVVAPGSLQRVKGEVAPLSDGRGRKD